MGSFTKNYAASTTGKGNRGGNAEKERFLDRLDSMTFPVEPCESEFGVDAFEQIVFNDEVYNALSTSIHGQRLWDSAEEEEAE
ncbi:MAG: hypothetical protein IKO55_11125 [Kiritimatiellae bacterium]|nr:hypothetical protein [Kiritimatiellia bacterium]